MLLTSLCRRRRKARKRPRGFVASTFIQSPPSDLPRSEIVETRDAPMPFAPAPTVGQYSRSISQSNYAAVPPTPRSMSSSLTPLNPGQVGFLNYSPASSTLHSERIDYRDSWRCPSAPPIHPVGIDTINTNPHSRLQRQASEPIYEIWQEAEPLQSPYESPTLGYRSPLPAGPESDLILNTFHNMRSMTSSPVPFTDFGERRMSMLAFQSPNETANMGTRESRMSHHFQNPPAHDPLHYGTAV